MPEMPAQSPGRASLSTRQGTLGIFERCCTRQAKWAGMRMDANGGRGTFKDWSHGVDDGHGHLLVDTEALRGSVCLDDHGPHSIDEQCRVPRPCVSKNSRCSFTRPGQFGGVAHAGASWRHLGYLTWCLIRS